MFAYQSQVHFVSIGNSRDSIDTYANIIDIGIIGDASFMCFAIKIQRADGYFYEVDTFYFIPLVMCMCVLVTFRECALQLCKSPPCEFNTFVPKAGFRQQTWRRHAPVTIVIVTNWIIMRCREILQLNVTSTPRRCERLAKHTKF